MTAVRTVALAVLALLVGAVVGFFIVGASLFADGSITEKLVMLAVATAIFAGAGGLLGRFAARSWLWVALALTLPAVAVAVLFGENPALTAAFAFCTFAAGVGAAAWAARGPRSRR